MLEQKENHEQKAIVKVKLPVELGQSVAGGYLTLRCSKRQTVELITKEIINKNKFKQNLGIKGKGYMPKLRQFQVINLKDGCVIDSQWPLHKVSKEEGKPYYEFELRNLQHPQEPVKTEINGYLWKLRKNSPTWKRRYFVVSNGILVYKKKEEQKVMTRLKLDGATIVKWPRDNQHGRPFLFGITPAKEKRMYVMDAGNEGLRKKWLDALRAHGAIFGGEIKRAFKFQSSIKEGYLKMQQGVYRNAKKYYVCLSKQHITVLSNQDAEEPLLTLEFTETDEIIFPVDTFTKFSIRRKNTNEIHRFQALNPDDRTSWLSELTNKCGLKLARTSDALKLARTGSGKLIRTGSGLKLERTGSGLKIERTGSGLKLERSGSQEKLEHLFPEPPALTKPIFGDGEDWEDDEFTEDDEEEDELFKDFPDFHLTNLDEELDDIEEETEFELKQHHKKYNVPDGDIMLDGIPYVCSLAKDIANNQRSSYAEGPGLNPDNIEEELIEDDHFTWFVIYVKDKNGKACMQSSCNVTLTGPRGKIEVTVKSFELGSFFVTYAYPLESGEYFLDARLSGPATPVRDFPQKIYIYSYETRWHDENNDGEGIYPDEYDYDDDDDDDDDEYDSDVPLMRAIYQGDLTRVKTYLSGETINARGHGGSTPLICAAREGAFDICNLLIEQKANLNDQDDDGKTALIHATVSNHVNLVDQLLYADADVRITENAGVNALNYAEDYGHDEIVELLENAAASSGSSSPSDSDSEG